MKEWQNSLLILCFWNENIKRVFVDHTQKLSSDKSKQPSTFLEIQNINKLSFKTRDSSFEHLLTYFSL